MPHSKRNTESGRKERAHKARLGRKRKLMAAAQQSSELAQIRAFVKRRTLDYAKDMEELQLENKQLRIELEKLSGQEVSRYQFCVIMFCIII